MVSKNKCILISFFVSCFLIVYTNFLSCITRLELNEDMVLSEVCVFDGENCVIEGNNKSLRLEGEGCIIIAPNSTVLFRDVIVEGIENNDILCMANNNKILFDDTVWRLANNYNFIHGSFEVLEGKSFVVERGIVAPPFVEFSYSSFGQSTVKRDAEFLLNTGILFNYNPILPFDDEINFDIKALEQLIVLEDLTSRLRIRDVSLRLSKFSWHLTTGRLEIEGRNFLVCDGEGRLVVCNGINEEKDLTVFLQPQAVLAITSGEIKYHNTK